MDLDIISAIASIKESIYAVEKLSLSLMPASDLKDDYTTNITLHHGSWHIDGDTPNASAHSQMAFQAFLAQSKDILVSIQSPLALIAQRGSQSSNHIRLCDHINLMLIFNKKTLFCKNSKPYELSSASYFYKIRKYKKMGYGIRPDGHPGEILCENMARSMQQTISSHVKFSKPQS